MNSQKTLILMLVCACSAICFAACRNNDIRQTEHTLNLTSGSVERYFCTSDLVDPRNIDVWLPAGYSPDGEYSVIYMHDGQMLFDSGNSWNSSEWGVDETMAALSHDGRINDAIVVGIWNNASKRHLEYFPQKAARYIDGSYTDSFYALYDGELLADRYLKFIVHHLKPFIDSRYPTRRGPESTFLAGSSMGGLISLYGICEYPGVFGGAACISTHWPGTFERNTEVPEAICAYLRGNLPDPASHRIYFDYGTEGLDASYPEFQAWADQIMTEWGYGAGNWLTLRFEGDDHNEKYWAARLDKPFVFLLGGR